MVKKIDTTVILIPVKLRIVPKTACFNVAGLNPKKLLRYFAQQNIQANIVVRDVWGKNSFRSILNLDGKVCWEPVPQQFYLVVTKLTFTPVSNLYHFILHPLHKTYVPWGYKLCQDLCFIWEGWRRQGLFYRRKFAFQKRLGFRRDFVSVKC